MSSVASHASKHTLHHAYARAASTGALDNDCTMTCELSPDIALNQVIAAALTQARRLARRDATRRALSEVAARYDEVSIPRRPLALSPALGRGLMADRTRLTKHARDRSTARDIPQGVIDLILAYGISSPARDGARRHALDKQALREIRRDFGREIAKAVAPFRTAYVIAADAQVITVARAARPIFH